MVSLITGVIGIATAITIVVLIRKDHLHVKYGLWWMAAAVAFALLGLFPRIVDYVAGHLGIGYPPVLALTLGVILLVLKILVMDIERSRNAIKLQRMVQRIALLESELHGIQGGLASQKPESNPREAKEADPTPEL